MNPSQYQHLFLLYDCRILLDWLENVDVEKDGELWQNVLRAVSSNSELNYLRNFLLETSQESITKQVFTQKIIEMLAEDGSMGFDTSLRSLCCTFRLLMVRKFSATDPSRPEPCFDI